ncbi:MAG: hypothetical protein E6R04_02975 [Spirochaetes bacterium]|nr:MAG: hypothetical protein E6R04_02975 [Spirochaetota bacterium]
MGSSVWALGGDLPTSDPERIEAVKALVSGLPPGGLGRREALASLASKIAKAYPEFGEVLTVVRDGLLATNPTPVDGLAFLTSLAGSAVRGTS